MKRTIGSIILLLALTSAAIAEVAETFETQAERATGIASNVAIDVTPHDGGEVWMATGKGVTYSPDGGATWYTFNTSHGLPANNLSAIHSVNGRIWVASNHNEMISDQLMVLSNGLSYTDDNGETWTTIDFGPDGLNIPYVIGGDRTVFDITGHTDEGYFNNRPTDNDAHWLFASAFAGGLLASQDGGINWKRIFPSRSDSAQFALDGEAPSLRNRYFSCAADTSHQDSLFLWAGTAAGVFQYVYAPPRHKLFSHWINDVAFCDSCSRGDGSGVFVAGRSGLSLASAAGGHLATRFEIDGLPGAEITAVESVGDVLIVATADPNTGTHAGFGVSTDGGETFMAATSVPMSPDSGRHVTDLAQIGGWTFAAGFDDGLYASADSGITWMSSGIPPTADPDRLATNSVMVDGDSLFVGTDAGLWKIGFIPPNAFSYGPDAFVPFEDSDTTGARVVGIRRQRWSDDYFDHSILWTIHRPHDSVVGTPMVGRFGPEMDTTFDTVTADPLAVDTTFDTLGFGWRYYRRGVEIRDIDFFSDTILMMGDLNLWFTPRFQSEPTNHFSIRQYANDTLIVASMDGDTITSMTVRQDTVIVGSSNGIAISTDRGHNFTIYRANTDSLAADVVINHSYLSSAFGLVGDFVPALAVQYLDTGPARIWAGARPATFGLQGISAAEFDPASGNLSWQTVYRDDFAWNFDFDGDTVFAATNGGLLMTAGPLDSLNTVWETVSLTDAGSGEVLIDPETEVYGVAKVDPYLWVGTDDGTVRLDLADITSQTLFRHVDSASAADEVYAFPVPFRPNRGQEVDFHFVVGQAGAVTLEVYDFAMNLVARPLDNLMLPAGIYPPSGSQGYTWDGMNMQGDLVAVGIYYFKVTLPNGDERWGKLAVIP